MTKRVIFSFDERSLAALRSLAAGRLFAVALRDSLALMRGLQSQAQQGYTELIIRNPATGERRVLVIPPVLGPLTPPVFEEERST